MATGKAATARFAVSLRVGPMFELSVWRHFMDIDVRASMVNHYGSSGNLR